MTPGAQHAQLRRAALGAHERALGRRGPSAAGAWHASHASTRKRPRRFSTHTAGPFASRSAVGERLGEQPRAGRLLAPVDDVRARPTRAPRRRAAARRARRPAIASASTVGAGDTTDHDAPARAARSCSTSRACQVGERSSWSASSASSTTIAAARSGTGASAAIRPPTTTQSPARGAPPRVGALPRRTRRSARTRPSRPVRAGTARATAPATRRRRDDRRPVGRAHRRDQRPPIDERRPPHHHSSEPASLTVVAVRRSVTPVRRFGGGGDAVGRAGATAGPRSAGRTSARRSSRSGRRRRAAGRRTRPRAPRAAARSVSEVDVVGDDPAAHAPAVQRDAHDRADAHQRRERVGNDVVEDALDRGDVGQDATDAGQRVPTPYRATPAARRSSSAYGSVFSQVKPSPSVRPKWPYAAVRLKIGRRRSSRSMIAAGRMSNTSRTIASSLLGRDLGRAERVDHDRHRVRDTDRVRDLRLAPLREARPRRPSSRSGARRTRPNGRPWSGPCPRTRRRRGGPCRRRCRR